MSLPSQLDLTKTQPIGVRASAKSILISPNNGGSFTNTSNPVIRIQLPSTDYLNPSEGYLKFIITNQGIGVPVAFSGVGSFIQRMRILSGSTIISDITNYNFLLNQLIQHQSSDDYLRYLNIVSGSPNYNYADGGAWDSIVPDGTNPSVYGNSFLATGQSVTVAVPIISGILATQKYIPLSLLASSLTIEITLDSYYETFINACSIVGNGNAGNPQFPIGTPNTNQVYTVSSVGYMANIITILDSKVDDMMRSMLASNGLVLHIDDYTASINNISPPANGGVSSQVLTIADRSQNAKAYLTFFKLPGYSQQGAMNSYKLGMSHYQYRVGSTFMPVSPVNVSNNNMTESFLELNKCFNQSIFNLRNTCQTDLNTFANDGFVTVGNVANGVFPIATWGGRTNNACFCAGIDLEAFSGGCESGLNTSALMTAITLNFDINIPIQTTACGVLRDNGLNNITVLTYVHRDSVVMIKPDGSVIVSV